MAGENSFGADQGTQNQGEGQGTSFVAGEQSDNSGQGSEGVKQYTQEEISALLTRDEHAQNHIKTLEQETANYRKELEELREKVDKATPVDELMEALRQEKGESTTIDIDDIVNKATQSVTSTLEQQTIKQQQESNFKTVAEAVQTKFGTDADAEMAKVAQSNDMTLQELIDLSYQKPNLVMKLAGLDKKQDAPTTPSQGSLDPRLFNQEPEKPKKSVMEMRTDRERVDDFNARLEAKLKELGQA